MTVRPSIYVDSSAFSATEAMRHWTAANERPRILLVARGPIGSVRAHLVANYAALCADGYRFTFVGPAGETLNRLRAGFDGIEGLGFVAAPVKNQRCRLWPAVRALLRAGRFRLLHSHGFTAALHSTLANLGIGVPHLVTLHKPLRRDPFPGWLGWLKRWMLHRALLQADGILTASGEARANLLEHVPSLRGRADRIFIVPNGTHPQHLKTLLQGLADRTLTNLPSEPLAA